MVRSIQISLVVIVLFLFYLNNKNKGSSSQDENSIFKILPRIQNTIRARAQRSFLLTKSNESQNTNPWILDTGSRYYIGPYSAEDVPSKITFDFKLSNLGGSYNTNVYIVCPRNSDGTANSNYTPGKDYQDANTSLNNITCPEYDLLETAGCASGAFAFHCSLKDLGQDDSPYADGSGCDRGVAIAGSPVETQSWDVETKNGIIGTWNPNTKGYVSNNNDLQCDNEDVSLRVTFSLTKNDEAIQDFKLTYNSFSSSDTEPDPKKDIVMADSTDGEIDAGSFNQMWAPGGVNTYNKALISDLNKGQFFFYTSVWKPGEWYAGIYDGFTKTNDGTGGDDVGLPSVTFTFAKD